MWGNVGKLWGLLWCMSIYKRISFWFSSIPTCLIWQYQTSVLSESSLKEVLLLLFLELFAQPGRACLLCFTPEFDKVLVSLAHRCLGASLCQVRVWSSANSWFPVVSPANLHICWDSWEINFLVSPFPPPLAKVFPLMLVLGSGVDLWPQLHAGRQCTPVYDQEYIIW